MSERALQPILIVEDDPMTLEYLAYLLQTSGYQVQEAANAEAARSYIKDDIARAILLDRRLPDADGLVLCREFRDRIGASIPIIMLTADARTGLAAQAEEAGATRLLYKPFMPQELETILAAVLQT